MKVHFKGIIRGVASELQAEGYEGPVVMKWEGESLEDVVVGLALPEWIYTLYVNGRRIVDPERYLKRKGIWNECIRQEI